MDDLINQLQALLPDLSFVKGSSFCWSPETRQIFYISDRISQKSIWSLMHETGHAQLGHHSYRSDFELLQIEMAAWEKAEAIAQKLGISIDQEHIQDCLDTYRDWLYKRSICPTCSTKCLQQSDSLSYRCFNCHTAWQVTASRFCRTYRSIKNGSLMPHLNAGSN